MFLFEADSRIKALESDLASAMTKFEMAQADLAKAYEAHNRSLRQ